MYALILAVAMGQVTHEETHKITYNGVTFSVRGTLSADRKSIDWDRSDPFNVKAYWAAKETADTKPAVTNFGLSLEKFSHEKGFSRYSANSNEAKRFVAEASDPAGTPSRLHVTVVGTDAERAKVVSDIASHPAFAGIRDRLLVQDYKQNEWAVDPALGFKYTGSPTILVQTARCQSDPQGGRVVYRSADYTMGPETLAEELRRVFPDYQPQRDPGPANPNRGGSCPLGFTRDHLPWVLGAAVVLFLIFRSPSKKA